MFSNPKEETEKKGFHQYAPDLGIRKKLRPVLYPVADNWSVHQLSYPQSLQMQITVYYGYKSGMQTKLKKN